MNNSDFCHIHIHTQYSLLDGYGSAEAYTKRSKELGFNYLSSTDHMNVDGLIQFQKACKAQEICPIMGTEAYIVPDMTIKTKGEKRCHITLLIKNQTGFENLCQLLTTANLEGFYYKPRIDFESLLNHCEGIVILTGCGSSFLNLSGGSDLLLKLRDKTDLYLEVMPHKMDQQVSINKKCLELSEQYRIKLCGSNDVHYVSQEDDQIHEILLAVQTKSKMSDQNRFRFKEGGFYLRSADEMIEAFLEQGIFTNKQIRELLKNTIEVAELCKDFRIKKQEIYLPKVPGYEDVDSSEFLRSICNKRLQELVGNGWSRGKVQLYQKRLEEEWAVIDSKKFAPYFMIIWELVEWCRKNDIMVGPGRGSIGGSLVAYLLQITMVDPMKWNLLFSRFIAEDRIDFPDADLDFEYHKHYLIREHLEQLYGKNNVTSISTFLTMKGRAAIRDVARVYEIPLGDVDAFTKTISYDDEEDSIVAAAKTEEGKIFAKKYPHIINAAIKLEGQIRGTSQHAAGIIISADDLTKGTRGYLAVRSDLVVSNWNMEDSEYVGLMKIDVLRLNTLSVLNETKRLVKENYGKNIDFEKIPLDDKNIFKEISDGNNVGVFQLSTWASTKLAKQIKCSSIEEISDIIALVRPGPSESGVTTTYIKRKHGAKWVNKHPRYEKILEKTYGLVCYQEQIMEIINKIAGLPYSVADKIRKIIGKKRDPKEFVQYEEAFVKGCLEQGILSEQEAEEFWELLQAHAHYSFNKCFSGKEIIDRGGKVAKKELTIEEMYFIKNNRSYAKLSGHISLNDKYRTYGYGSTLSMYDDFRIRKNNIKDIRYSGKQNVYCVTTLTGRKAHVSINHKFPTPQGEKRLAELKIGDELYINAGYENKQEQCNFYDGDFEVNWPKKGEKGFQENKHGRSVVFEKTRIQHKKLRNSCEICGKNYCKGFELHHKDGNKQNNNQSNLMWVCNSCHKKYHYQTLGRMKIFEKGLPTKLETIRSIELIGEENTYDVEMESPYHNLVLKSGIVASNSHSIAYAILGYWTSWCKKYFPTEFICACLTFGSDDKDKKNETIKEAFRLGLNVILPQKGVSHPTQWVAKSNSLYIPFIEIKGVGEKIAEQCNENKEINLIAKPEIKGFFTSIGKKKENPPNRLKKFLEEINQLKNNGDYDTLKKYFNFIIVDPNRIEDPFVVVPKETQQNIRNTFFVQKSEFLIRKVEKFNITELQNCYDCRLGKECDYGPVPPSIGEYNIAIFGEAPGCISGNSFIDVAFRDKSKYPEGIKIKDLVGKHDFYIYSFDVSGQKIVIDKAKRVWKTGIKKVYKVTYEWSYAFGEVIKKKQNSLIVTSNHKFLLKKPMSRDPFKGINDGKNDYLSIDDGLTIGHSLQPFYRTIDSKGYAWIKSCEKKNIKEAKMLLEFKINKKLVGVREQSHHKNKNPSDDTYDNLEFLDVADHASFHSRGDENIMHDPEIKAKHTMAMQSMEYRSNMSFVMKEVFKDSIIYQERLKQIENSKEQISKTVTVLFDDPIYYYHYLLGKVNSEYFNVDELWMKMKFKKKFPNCDFPPTENHKIVSIEYLGEEEVFDLKTERYHNFVANGVFVHNSDEDIAGEGFVGRAGQVLWQELDKYGFRREQFYLSNQCHCFPRLSKTPSSEDIQACSKWVHKELLYVKPCIILSFGNTGLKGFGKNSRITLVNGKSEWNSQWNAWIVWCIHPSAVLHNPSNKDLFAEGVSSFINKINELGG